MKPNISLPSLNFAGKVAIVGIAAMVIYKVLPVTAKLKIRGLIG